MEENDDQEIDDITENLNKKKKIKSGRKGKVGEAQIVNLLNERFFEVIKNNPDAGAFSRSIGSGNRFGQRVHLSKNAIETFSGDLTTPTNFKFVIESKNGYNDIDILDCFSGKCRGVDEFLKQVSTDAERCEKYPMLIWKKDRKDRIAFVKKNLFGDEELYGLTSSFNIITYLDWIGIELLDLLKKPDTFFFRGLQTSP